MSTQVRLATGFAMGSLLFGAAQARTEEAGSLSLRVPEAERVVSIRTPTLVEIETTIPGAIVGLLVDGRAVLVSNRPKTSWRLDPNRWLRGSGVRRVKLRLVVYNPKGVQTERTLFVHLGELPALLEP